MRCDGICFVMTYLELYHEMMIDDHVCSFLHCFNHGKKILNQLNFHQNHFQKNQQIKKKENRRKKKSERKRKETKEATHAGRVLCPKRGLELKQVHKRPFAVSLP